MKTRFWVGIALWMSCNAIIAATPTMQYASQPSENVYSLPVTLTLNNLAPVPQNLCSPTLSTGGERATCSGLPVCQGFSSQTASFSCSVTTTCDSTVPSSKNGGSCSVALNVTKPSDINASTPFSFTVSYGSYHALLISNAFTLNGTNPSPPAQSYRTITFKNSCNYTTWFGTIAGAAPTNNVIPGMNCMGTDSDKAACVSAGGACYSRIGADDACLSQACGRDSDCVTGASCYSKTNTCFWNNPTPDSSSFQLTPGGTSTVQIPQYESNGIGVVWSGAFSGRTGCTTSSRISALCTRSGENAQGICSLGVGFQQPATQSEPTFITFPTGSTPTAPTDSYDVTLINGANIPMSMYPTNQALPTSGNPYTCGAAGYNTSIPITAPTGDTIGASSWQLATNQANLAYRYVVQSTSTPTRCAADTDCASSEYCGLSYSASSIGSSSAPGSGYLVCGAFAGWLTADQICGTNQDFTNAIDKNGTSVENFQCNYPITNGTMSNLYQCNQAYDLSCYSSTSSNCCGCVNWSTQGTTILLPSNTAYVAACEGVNSTWTGGFSPATQPQVYETILYLKKSCPSCYTYPFDDKSSSFTCTDGSTTANNTENYTVEFCPGGNGITGFKPPAH